jgi:hypothetical protein
MDAHEFVHFEVDFDLNNPYQPTDEEIVQMLSSQHPMLKIAFKQPLLKTSQIVQN